MCTYILTLPYHRQLSVNVSPCAVRAPCHLARSFRSWNTLVFIFSWLEMLNLTDSSTNYLCWKYNLLMINSRKSFFDVRYLLKQSENASRISVTTWSSKSWLYQKYTPNASTRHLAEAIVYTSVTPAKASECSPSLHLPLKSSQIRNVRHK